jgi:tetratricopeptide (TPR) repeat protein
LCGAAVLPYLIARAAAGGDEGTLAAYVGNRLSKHHDLGRCLEGVWAGLRLVWILVFAYFYVAVRTVRGSWKPVVVLVVPFTVVGMLFLAGDYSRSMSMLLPAALLGVWLCVRERWRRGPELLAGALALNLLLPAQHVVGAFVSPIYYVHHEIERYRNPPPYLTGEAQYRQGQRQEAAGDIDAAIASYDAAIALNPRAWAVYAQRGFARATRNEWSAALADYRRALELAPVDWPQRADVERLAAQAQRMGPTGSP